MTNLRPWPDNPPAREWQKEAWWAYEQKDGPSDFLCVATPGSGKTRWALRIAHRLLQSWIVQRIVVVTPTDHLRRQWARDADRCGLDLDPGFSNSIGQEGAGYHGVVLTYAQVSRNPEVHRALAGVSTLVILDEIHHAGDSKSWGEDLRYAFENATRRLALSGTPFRTDNTPIPFVTYSRGVCQADYSYTYEDALREEGVVRDAFFVSFEGDMDWMNDGERVSANFATVLDPQGMSQRLRTALAATGEWLPDVITNADARLQELRRNGHPDAGGLIVATHQGHARAIADMMRAITGERPPVAISDDPDASVIIKSFGESAQRWLVAVKMVSEGVDIPRLRVGVYATNVTTEMYFRQLVGRFVRWQASLDCPQPAYLYFPKDPRLVALTQTIRAESERAIQDTIKRAREWSQQRLLAGDRDPDRFQAIGAQAWQDDIYDSSGDAIDPELLATAGLIQTSFMPLMPREQIAGILGAYEEVQGKPKRRRRTTGVVTRQPRPEVPLFERQERLRRSVRRMVGSLNFKTGEEFSSVYRRLNGALGVSQLRLASEDQLRQGVEIVASWLSQIDSPVSA